MSRLAELFEHPGTLSRHMPDAMMHRPKTSIFSVVMLGLAIAALVWMWPELQRYLKIKRM